MGKTTKIKVEEKLISVVKQNEQDYICMTDMVRGEGGTDHIRNWMRNRNTVEFLGLWETLHNPDFKGVEFDRFRKEAGLNSFNQLKRIAISQLKTLDNKDFIKSLKRLNDKTYLGEEKKLKKK